MYELHRSNAGGSSYSKSAKGKYKSNKAKNEDGDVESIRLDVLCYDGADDIQQSAELIINSLLIPTGTDANQQPITKLDIPITVEPHPNVRVITIASEHKTLDQDSGATAHITSDRAQFTRFERTTLIPIRGFGSHMSASAPSFSRSTRTE